MLDVHFLRDNLEAVKANVRNRGVKADPERAVQLDDERKRLVQEAQVKQQRATKSPSPPAKRKTPPRNRN